MAKTDNTSNVFQIENATFHLHNLDKNIYVHVGWPDHGVFTKDDIDDVLAVMDEMKNYFEASKREILNEAKVNW